MRTHGLSSSWGRRAEHSSNPQVLSPHQGAIPVDLESESTVSIKRNDSSARAAKGNFQQTWRPLIENAESAFAEGRYDIAIDFFRRAIERQRKYSRGASDVTVHRLGLAYWNAGDLVRARETFSWSLNIREHPAVRCDLGVVERILGNILVSIQHLRDALRQDPSKARHHSELGQSLTAYGKNQDACIAFKEAIRLERGEYASSFFGLGLALRRLSLQEDSPDKRRELLQEARDVFEEAQRLNDGKASYHTELGTTLRLLNDRRCVREGERAVTLEPNNVRARFEYAVSLRKFDQAARALKILTEMRRGYVPREQQAKLEWEVGVTLQKLGDEREASVAFQRAKAIDPHIESRWVRESSSI